MSSTIQRGARLFKPKKSRVPPTRAETIPAHAQNVCPVIKLPGRIFTPCNIHIAPTIKSATPVAGIAIFIYSPFYLQNPDVSRHKPTVKDL
jgi:hypothetical protein